MTINTPFGRKIIVRRVGTSGEYYQEASTGDWWTCNPQHGFVPVASNSRALQAAIAGEEARRAKAGS